MPVYDGLALVQMALAANLFAHFVIVSGYRNFEYAHKAIQFGVTDYLLKPLNQQELQQTLEKLCRKIRDEQATLCQRQELSLLRQEKDAEQKQHFIDLLWQQKAIPETLAECNELFGLAFYEGYFQAVLINVSDSALMEKQCGFTQQVMDDAQKFLGREGVVVAGCSEDAVTLVVNYTAAHERPISNTLLLLYGRIRSYVDIYGDFDLVICTGSPTPTLRTLPQSFAEARYCEKNKLFSGWNQVSSYTMPQSVSQSQSYITNADIHTLTQVIDSCSVDLMQGWFQAWEGRLSALRNVHAGSLYKARDTLVQLLSNLPDFSVDALQSVVRSTDRADSLTGFVNLLRLAFIHALQNISEERIAQQNYPIIKAQEYIQKNYDRPITLEMVAGYVNLSVAYFSSQFKKVTGSNYIDYLTDVRMENAKTLLKESKLSSQKIAERVGYTDYKHFRMLFKKSTGLTPADYRRLYI